MRVAPEGTPFIAGAWLIAIGLLALWDYGGWPVWPLLAWMPVAVWVVAFFRDPERNGPRGERLILAPA
ncbi:MAG: hypothetical protein ACOY71_07420, partial [Gemmatimonadota bacterium]